MAWRQNCRRKRMCCSSGLVAKVSGSLRSLLGSPREEGRHRLLANAAAAMTGINRQDRAHPILAMQVHLHRIEYGSMGTASARQRRHQLPRTSAKHHK
jgi:hypothetical protein